jgi:hypothetical protein
LRPHFRSWLNSWPNEKKRLVYIYKERHQKYITLSDLAIIFFLKTESVTM